jgi:dipeptidase D
MLSSFEPKALWQNFELLNAVPRASKKEAAIIAYVKAFGSNLNLSVYEDEVGNIIIKKPASAGMEGKPTICLQGHLDMVHQKNNDTVFDFATDGIKMYIDGDWVKAKGTTLGADNGLGVAAILAILESNTIVHPPIEALFTIDEETGMTGALALQGGLLDATYMLNLDTEEDDELTIGCAGGIDVTGTGKYNITAAPINVVAYKITLNGLTGGHSGIDIHKGRANANKLMNRVLWNVNEKCNMQICSIDGGSLRNAIPRESVAFLNIEAAEITAFEEMISTFNEMYKAEFLFTDPNLNLKIEKLNTVINGLDKTTQQKLLQVIYSLPNGIYRMDSNIEGLVQTSNNLARIEVKEGEYSIKCLTRSSVNTEKLDLVSMLQSCFNMLGAETTFGGSYPGWAPKPDSDLVKLMVAKYKELHNNEMPKVNACHAGLECGILGTNYPTMQMISFGPTIHGAHSPDEKASIPSAQKFWKYLLVVLESFKSYH